MHVLFVAPELAPFASTGDAGEAVASLAAGLVEEGTRVTVVTPFYAGISAQRYGLARRIRKLTFPVAEETATVEILDGKFLGNNVGLVFVDHPPSFQRAGLYGDEHGPYADNPRRFFVLCESALLLAEELQLDPDLIHLHGWPAGMLPLLLRRRPDGHPLRRAKRVFSLDDPRALGLFDPELLDELHLGRDEFHPEGIEFYGQVSLLKAGVTGCERVCAPSPSGARALASEAGGGGLHGLFEALRGRTHGILPGIDLAVWNPAADHRIAQRYEASDLSGKAACKRALQGELQLPLRPQVPLVAVRGPFSEEGDLGRLCATLAELPPGQLQTVFVGRSHPGITELAGREGAQIAHRGDDEVDLHRLLAGADAVLLPHRHAGATTLQLKALRYGTVPVVHHVGAYLDTVVDFDPPSASGTGVCFQALDGPSLQNALSRLLALYAAPVAWTVLVKNGMRQEHGLRRSAARYREVYAGLLEGRPASSPS